MLFENLKQITQYKHVAHSLYSCPNIKNVQQPICPCIAHGYVVLIVNMFNNQSAHVALLTVIRMSDTFL